MGPIACPETSAINYNSTLRTIPEEHRSHWQGGGSLKSHSSFPLCNRKYIHPDTLYSWHNFWGNFHNPIFRKLQKEELVTLFRVWTKRGPFASFRNLQNNFPSIKLMKIGTSQFTPIFLKNFRFKLHFFVLSVLMIIHYAAIHACFQSPESTGLFEMTVGVLTNATSFSRCNPVWFLSMGLHHGSSLCSSCSRKYPGTKGTNHNRH